MFQVVAEIIIYSHKPEENNLTDLHLLGLNSFGGTSLPIGHGLFPMYKWATEHVGQHEGLLEGYRLVIHFRDSQVSLTMITYPVIVHSSKCCVCMAKLILVQICILQLICMQDMY